MQEVTFKNAILKPSMGKFPLGGFCVLNKLSRMREEYFKLIMGGREMEKTLVTIFTISTLLVFMTLAFIFFSTQKSFLIELIMMM